MPAAGKPPSLADYLKAYQDAVHGDGAGDSREDVRRGSGYDVVNGVDSLLWAKQSGRDRQLFRNAYTETARGDDLSRQVEAKYGGIQRIENAYGTGTLSIARPSGGLAGTLYEGTRVEVLLGGGVSAYAIGADVDVTADALTVDVPIRATVYGPDGAATATATALRLADIVFDPTFVPAALACGKGTLQESAIAYIARARQAKLDARVGFDTSIIAACQAAGAINVIPLDAGAFGDDFDFGLSYVYVGDASYSTSPALIQACRQVLDLWTVAGCDVQALGMQQATVTVSIAVVLWDTLDHFDLTALRTAIAAAVVDEFVGRRQWWTFRTDSIQGAVQRVHSAIQTATVTTSPTPPAAGFPPVLTRYVLSAAAVAMTFASAA